MHASRLVAPIAIALAASASMPARAADNAATQALNAQLARIKTLRAERPGDGLLAYYQAMTQAQLGDRDGALIALRGLLGRRLGLVPVHGTGFDAIWDDAAFRSLRAELAADETATPPSPVEQRLHATRLVTEGIAYDARRQRFFIGSAQRSIIAVDRGGPRRTRVREFSRPSDRLDAVLGLVVHRGSLYAVSTNGFLDSARSGRRNAVLRYDLGSGRLAARIDAPAALQLNDIAIATDGTLYATDTAGGTLLRRKPGEKLLMPIGHAGALPGANGIAVAPDGKALYVAVSTGIARVDAATGEARRMAQPDSVVTGGIDGLYWHGGALLGVQNATNPGRVIRIELVDAGSRIAGITTLQSHHHPDFDEPTTGTIVDGRALVVIANSQLSRLRPDGTLNEAAMPRPLVLVAVPIAG